jgi:hypothetical protein
MSLAATHSDSGPSIQREANDIFLVSDLHLADGRKDPFGKFAPGENFFWDDAFDRFLRKMMLSANGKGQTLVINGDFIDFLRIEHVPRSPEDNLLVQRWNRFLAVINHPASSTDLYATDDSEKEYGFKTNDYKCVWKLLLVFEGHTVFVHALRVFLDNERNKLLIVKGNHDLEFHWEAVRQAFVYFLAEEDPAHFGNVNDRVEFYESSLVINDTLHIEHGNVFDPVNYATPDTLQGNPSELLLSVGALFNRYVINKFENIDPLFDNLKPPTGILKAVALHSPKQVLKIVFYHLIGALKIVQKRHVRYAAKIVGKVALVGLPLLAFGTLLILMYFTLQDSIQDGFGRWILNSVASLSGALVVRWIQTRLAASTRHPHW